jgi:hypothetical protein
MERRRLLALSGLGVLTSFSGCGVGRGWCSKRRALFSNDPETPAGMTVETKNWSDGLLDSRGRRPQFAVVVTSGTEAKDEVRSLRTNREDYDPITFIEETNFDDSSLILVEWMGSSSSDDLTLSRIERRENGVHVIADVIEPCGAKFADMSAHSLFVRVTDEQENAPERATVQVNE